MGGPKVLGNLGMEVIFDAGSHVQEAVLELFGSLLKCLMVGRVSVFDIGEEYQCRDAFLEDGLGVDLLQFKVFWVGILLHKADELSCIGVVSQVPVGRVELTTIDEAWDYEAWIVLGTLDVVGVEETELADIVALRGLLVLQPLK